MRHSILLILMMSRSKSGITTLAPVVILVSQGPQQQGEVRTRHHMAASSPVRPLFSHLTTNSSDGQTHSPLAFLSLRSTLLPGFCLFFSLSFSFLSPKGMEGPHHQKKPSSSAQYCFQQLDPPFAFTFTWIDCVEISSDRHSDLPSSYISQFSCRLGCWSLMLVCSKSV